MSDTSATMHSVPKPVVLVTGATGFIGKALVVSLLESNAFQVITPVRTKGHSFPPGAIVHYGLDLSDTAAWSPLLVGVDCIIHCAAKAHVASNSNKAFEEEIMKVNAEATASLASEAAKYGVKQFIFVSTIGVHGNQTRGEPLRSSSPFRPSTAYARAKLAAEERLNEIQASSSMAVTVVRPPLVYGPNAPGNFGKLIALLRMRVPMPFGAVHNKRSLVFLGNLVSLIHVCILNPVAANGAFLVSDGEDLSTTDLLARLKSVVGGGPILPIPQSWLSFGAALLGANRLSEQLLGSLQVDISKTVEALKWSPPFSVAQGLRKSVAVNK
jgi:nucleoside-diphosphate-sugar epimerase